MPDVIRNGSVEIDLKLHGDKIKLESRPVSRESTASSRSAYLAQGSSRPVSAVPKLALYTDKEDYVAGYRSRRPYSADNFPAGKADSSVEELPSSELLKSLISEPIVSWRNGLDSRQMKLSANYKSGDEVLNAPCQLTPGLTGKPPIPTKRDKKSEKDVRFEDLDEESTYSKELEEISSRLSEIGHGKRAEVDINPPDLIADNPIQYQNWISDECLADDAEKRTDIILEKLRQQQKELGLDEEQEKPSLSKKPNDLLSKLKEQQLDLGLNYDNYNLNMNPEDESPKRPSISFEKFFADVPPIDLPSEKIITLTERPLEKPRSHRTNIKKKVEVAKAKPNVKFAPKPAEKKPEPAKGKFVAKTMRSGKDCVEKPAPLDNDVSWMSRPEKSEEVQVQEKKVMKVDVDDDDEITALLEVLEAESQKSQSNIQSIKKIVSSELQVAINTIPSTKKDDVDDKSTASSLHCSRAGKDSPTTVKEGRHSSTSNPTSSVSNNFKEILCFLDEVDKCSAQSVSNAKERIMIATEMIEGRAINLDTIPRLEDLLSHTPVELGNQVIELNLRLKEKSSAIRTLQDELSSLREHVMRTTRQTEKIVKEKVKSQKEESDTVVRRHQKFIDQLISEKKGLSQQCENLVHEMRMAEERFATNTKAADHRHQIELQKVKDMHIAGEKIRRERWLETKTQKIKEMTVKSIEPEMQSMTVRHEKELGELRSVHKREIEDIELKNARKMQQQCEAIRAQMTEEREKALAHEREVMRLRYESMVESEEKSYQDQRKRLMQEHAHRMTECEAREEAAVADKDRAVKQVHDEYEDKLQSIVRRHANEVKMLRETTELEMETWKNNCRKQLEAQLVAKEGALREQLRKERDREIEHVIERLETEANEARAQLESTTENRIRRLKDKFEKEIKDLESSEKDAKSKYGEMKGKLLENEDSMISLKASSKHLEVQLREAQELSEKLTEERSALRRNVEEEMRAEISAMEKEIERIKDDRDAELHQVYARVKVAVGRKDEMLSELSRDNVAMKEKCKYLEDMLEQQRKDYLIK